MMRIRRFFKSLEGAISAVVKKDKDHILIMHRLKKGERIKSHYHPVANEWLIIKGGSFEALYGSKDVVESENLEKDRFCLLHFPARTEHAFLAKSNLRYWVLRDRKDKIVYPKRPKKAKKSSSGSYWRRN